MEKAVEFKRNEDGTINWREMVPAEFLYVNKEYFTRFNKPVPSSIEGLKDNQLLIKLGGIKYVAKLRGYSAVDFDVVKADRDHVVVKCSILWDSGNQMGAERFSSIGAAHLDNTNQFMHDFLEASAENRAFVRAVRNYLGINIVGDDEIKQGSFLKIEDQTEADEGEDSSDPKVIFKNAVKKKGVSSTGELLELFEKKKADKIFLQRMSECIKDFDDLSQVTVKDCRIAMVYLNG